jgi:multiple sugar transport system ATP-binding protein
VVGIRPECFEDASLAQPGKPTIEVEPTVVEELGSEVHALFPVDAPRVSVESVDSASGAASLLAQAQSLFTARLDARTRAKPFARISLAVDPDRFHYFDPDTGENLLAAEGATAADATQHPELAAR